MTALGIALMASLSFVAASSAQAVSQSKQPAPSPAAAKETTKPRIAQTQEAWQAEMSRLPVPKKGCSVSTFPAIEWRQVACAPSPTYPQPPRRGPRPLVVGNLDDVSAQAPSGFISSAKGSFDLVSGVTSESGPIGNSGPSIANAYTLQINTDFFSTTICPATSPLCKGWQQFVFENNGTTGRAYIQYWLIKFNAPCPGGVGWHQFSFTGSTDIYCWKNNSSGVTTIPAQPITNLGQLTMTGTVSAGSDSNVVTTDPTHMYSVAGDNAVNAAAGWKIAEFNVFADGGNSSGGGQASFNSGSTVVPRTTVTYGGTAAPICTAQGFTGETNNLTFGPSAPTASGVGPAIAFTESSAGGSPSDCSAATTIGDTHLTTFGNVYYDFQAAGDFVLAQAGSGFLVETRQVSGAPTWPDATVNKAVAVQAGRSRVEICLPGRVVIDGKPTTIQDGGQFGLAGDGNVIRKGNVYYVLAPTGDSIRATLNGAYIDISVGLGRWPNDVHGLLGYTNRNTNAVVARDGTVFPSPFSFTDLYQRYGDSWRVAAGASLLSNCAGRETERRNPSKPFFANDLDPQVAKRTRAICVAAGVKLGVFLDSCTLDVAVIGSETAAKVFVGLPAPKAVGNPAARRDPYGKRY